MGERFDLLGDFLTIGWLIEQKIKNHGVIVTTDNITADCHIHSSLLYLSYFVCRCYDRYTTSDEVNITEWGESVKGKIKKSP